MSTGNERADADPIADLKARVPTGFDDLAGKFVTKDGGIANTRGLLAAEDANVGSADRGGAYADQDVARARNGVVDRLQINPVRREQNGGLQCLLPSTFAIAGALHLPSDGKFLAQDTGMPRDALNSPFKTPHPVLFCIVLRTKVQLTSKLLKKRLCQSDKLPQDVAAGEHWLCGTGPGRQSARKGLTIGNSSDTTTATAVGDGGGKGGKRRMSEGGIDEDLKTRVAWLYYVEGMTQDEVAQKVGLTRARVLRILANARNDGTVQIRVTSRLSLCIELERQLEATWKLERAIVVPTPEDADSLYRIIGCQLGAFLSSAIEPGMNVGLGWGNTLTNAVSAIEPREADGVNVVSLLGGLTRVADVNPSEFAWRAADRLSAACHMMAAPVFAPDRVTRDALFRHAGIAEVMRRARMLDMAVLSLGDLTPHSVFSAYDLLSSDEIASLGNAGVVGDILCQFVNAEGEVVDHPVNDRVVSLKPEGIREARRIVIASGGWNKVTIMRAALKCLSPSVVITDEVVAERLAAG